MIDHHAAAQFVAAHARPIDRRRLGFLEGRDSAETVLRALAAHRDDDGGLAQLEPDLRSPASQPACLLYALQILHEIDASDRSLAIGALDWLSTVTTRTAACRSCWRAPRAGRTRPGSDPRTIRPRPC